MSKHIRAKRQFSQNFFQSPELLDQCLDQLALTPQSHVLEIGPGPGVLTDRLLQRGYQVTAVEIDRDMIPRLEKRFGHHSQFHLIQGDIMQFDFQDLLQNTPQQDRKLIANIPYHLTSPIILKALNEQSFKQGLQTNTPLFSEICLMVQAEVGARLAAESGTKAWGALSISVQYAAEVDILMDLPKQLFKPMPKVDSAMVRLIPRHESPINVVDYVVFWTLVKRIFQMRRKTLRNVLKAWGQDAQVLEAIAEHYDLKIRGEVLELKHLAQISDIISKHTLAS